MKLFASIIFALCFVCSVFSQKQSEVTVEFTYVRAEPTVMSAKVKTLQRGSKVALLSLKETNGWLYVSILGTTNKGWIRRDTISEPKTVETPKTAPPTVSATPDVPKAIPPQVPTKQKNRTRIAAALKPEISKPDILPPPSPETDGEPPPIKIPIIEDNEVLVVETTEVSLNVRVVNAANRPVVDLAEAQFKVYEDDVLQPITSMTTAEVPLINAIVIDNSRSLRSQLLKVIEAGKIIVRTNRPEDQTAVVRFVSSNKIEVVQDFTSGKNLLENALDNLFVEGGLTAIIDAVYQTAKKVERYQNSDKKEDVKLRSLILVSDGDDRGSNFNEEQLIKLLRDSNVQIYSIGFINNLSETAETGEISRREKARGFLTRLAKETGGKAFFPDSLEELPAIAKDISGELRTQYLISYSPTDSDQNRTFRAIKVEVADGPNQEKRTAITRSGRNIQPE